MHQSKPTKPWFKQFWPWFLIALPSSAVIASFVTIGLAVTHAPTITTDQIGKFARENTVITVNE